MVNAGLVRRGVVAAALAGGALAALMVSAAAYAPGNPAVIHDAQASADPYGAATPPGGNQDAVQPNTEIEPSIAVNPGDPNDVVTAFQVGRVDAGGDADNGFASSLSGGAAGTWHDGLLPGLTKAAPSPVLVPHLCASDPNPEAFDRASDAVVAFGKDPTGKAHGGYIAYAQSLVFDDFACNPGVNAGNQSVNTGSLPSGMGINLSYDGGLTWTPATILQSDDVGGLNDKNWVLADNGTGPGHHPGRVYVVWDRVDPIVYSYCDPDVTSPGASQAGCDQLANWSSVNNNSWYVLFPGQGIGTQPVVMNSGDLGVMFTSLTSNPCAVDASTDQPSCNPAGNNIEFGIIPGAGSVPWPAPLPGTSFAPVTVDTIESTGVQYQRAGGLPSLAYDTTTGDVVIGWEDNRFRTDGGATPGSGDTSQQNDAVVAVSTPVSAGQDAGLTWSSPIRVNQDPTNDYVDHWNTMIAVGGDGILRVGYRQRQEPPGGFTTATMLTPYIDTYYQESRDQGTPFTAPVLANTAVRTDPQFGAFSRFTLSPPEGLFLGDYNELAAGGPDQTYVVRDEAFAPHAGATCNTGFLNPMSCQNQRTFVAQLAPENAASTPDARFVPALALTGAAVIGATLWRRRRTATPRTR